MGRHSGSRLGWMVLALAAAVAAQQAPIPTFRVETHVVNLAVVATNRAGNPVRDLRATDLTLAENGKPQRLLSFEAADGGTAGAPASGPPTAAKEEGNAAGGSHLRYLAFVFDDTETGANDRHRAIAAARAWVARDHSPDDLIAVISLGDTVRMWQVFTSDRRALNLAFDRLMGQSAPLTSQSLDDLLGAMRQCRALAIPLYNTSAGVNQPGALPEVQCGQSVARQYQLRKTHDLERHESVLNDLVLAMRAFPGEKRLVYLGDGLRLNPGRLAYLAFRIYFGNSIEVRSGAVGSDSDILRLLTSAAVRAHVTFDTIDAHGLRADAPAGNAAQYGPPLIKTLENPADIALPSMQAMTQDFEHEAIHGAEDSLAQLAADTGGRTFFGNNDLTSTIERAVGDYEGTYYISYRPTDQKLDGKYRAITLRSLRPGVHLATRRGYFADAVKQIPITARAAAPVASGGRWEVPVECTLPAAALAWQRAKGQPARDALVAVRTLLDPRGRVLAGSVEVFMPTRPKDGTVLYAADTILPAGKYTYLITLTEARTGSFASITLPLRIGARRLVAVRRPQTARPAMPLMTEAEALASRDCPAALRLLAAAPAAGVPASEAGAMHVLRARCYERLGERQRAAFEDEQALASGDDTAAIHEALGRYYLAVSPPLARAHLAQAVALDPGRAPALEPLINHLTPLAAGPADPREQPRLLQALAASAVRFEARFSQAAAVETLDEREVQAAVGGEATPPRTAVIESQYVVVRGADGHFDEYRAPLRVNARAVGRKGANFARYDLTHQRFQGLAFALTLLDAAHQRGLSFDAPIKRSTPGGPEWELGFEQRPLANAPSLARLGTHLEGRVWLNAATLRPTRLEVVSLGGETVMTFSVRYEYNAKIGCVVPDEIHASDVLPDRASDQLAFHYADFQRFGSRSRWHLLH